MPFRLGFSGRFGPNRMKEIGDRVKAMIPRTLTRIAVDADKQLKTDYLKRGGSFTRTKNPSRSSGYGRPAKTKTSGYAWVKNPGVWLRWGTGNLARSWIHVSAILVSANKWQSRIESRGVPYARIHIEGGWAGRNHSTWIPKRDYMNPMLKDNMPKWRDWMGQDLHAAFQ